MQRWTKLEDLGLTPRRVVAAILILGGLAVLGAIFGPPDLPALHRRASETNGVLIFVLLTVLPLAGLPVTVTEAVAGVRFGLAGGILVVTAAIVLQLLASYALVRALPRFFARRFGPLRRRLPPAAHDSLTVFTMMLPGVPYFAQNYVLPLVGVPLGTYLKWSIPIHAAKATVGIYFGSLSDDLTPVRVAGFGLYGLVVTGASLLAFRRLQARLRNPSTRGDGR
jgi:uncharacterized membrane protein YdjX (TVP38/TMEM64 family)